MENRMPRLKDYLDLALKGKKWIILSTLISMLAAGTVSLFLPDVYEAKAMLYIRIPFLKTEILPESIAIIESGQSLVSRFRTKHGAMVISFRMWEEILKEQKILNEIIDKLKLDKMTAKRLDRLLEVERLEEQRSYSAVKYSPALKILAQVKGDSGLAADIVNTWGGIFVQKFNAFYLSQLKDMHRVTLREFEASKEKLEKAEGALLQFKISCKEEAKSSKQQLEEMSLSRNLEEAKSSYELFRQKRDEAKIMLEERAPRAIVISKAVKPREAIRPNIALIVGPAGLAGFFVSVFLVIGLGYSRKEERDS
jgi:uncharacterized protein involved in exopolysaccharide biosynthesis